MLKERKWQRDCQCGTALLVIPVDVLCKCFNVEETDIMSVEAFRLRPVQVSARECTETSSCFSPLLIPFLISLHPFALALKRCVSWPRQIWSRSAPQHSWPCSWASGKLRKVWANRSRLNLNSVQVLLFWLFCCVRSANFFHRRYVDLITSKQSHYERTCLQEVYLQISTGQRQSSKYAVRCTSISMAKRQALLSTASA